MSRRMRVVAGIAAALLAITAVLVQMSRDGEADSVTPQSIAGNEFRVVGGLNQELPERLVLGEDGTFLVIDGGRTIDSGTFVVDGDEISFLSVWERGRGPVHYGVLWAEPDCAGCHAINVRLISDKCEGVVGDYRIVIDPATSLTFEVVWDECLQRTLVANGLQLVRTNDG